MVEKMERRKGKLKKVGNKRLFQEKMEKTKRKPRVN